MGIQIALNKLLITVAFTMISLTIIATSTPIFNSLSQESERNLLKIREASSTALNTGGIVLNPPIDVTGLHLEKLAVNMSVVMGEDTINIFLPLTILSSSPKHLALNVSNMLGDEPKLHCPPPYNVIYPSMSIRSSLNSIGSREKTITIVLPAFKLECTRWVDEILVERDLWETKRMLVNSTKVTVYVNNTVLIESYVQRGSIVVVEVVIYSITLVGG